MHISSTGVLKIFDGFCIAGLLLKSCAKFSSGPQRSSVNVTLHDTQTCNIISCLNNGSSYETLEHDKINSWILSTALIS
jgi:hypothetical protein